VVQHHHVALEDAESRELLGGSGPWERLHGPTPDRGRSNAGARGRAGKADVDLPPERGGARVTSRRDGGWMRVLFADKLPDRGRVRLAAQGFEVRSEPGLEGSALEERVREFGPAVLVVRGTQVTAAHAGASPRLALVVRAGAGVNTIDVP